MFSNCSSSLVSHSGEGNVEYQCEIFANPPAEVSIYFMRDLENGLEERVTLNPGDIYSSYHFLGIDEVGIQ